MSVARHDIFYPSLNTTRYDKNAGWLLSVKHAVGVIGVVDGFDKPGISMVYERPCSIWKSA